MAGALWAVVAGVGFGVFQTLSRRAVQGMDVYPATFMQLLISALVLAAAAAASGEFHLLPRVSGWAWLNFSLAGFFHFFLGLTLMNASQQHIGAARTGSLIGTTPLFAAVIAAVTLGEVPALSTIAGILLMVGGVYLVHADQHQCSQVRGAGLGPRPAGWRSLLLGLGAPLCWAISPIFTRHGLAALPSPMLGVTIGITTCVLVYAIALGGRCRQAPVVPFATDALPLKLLTGLLMGVSIWARWVALDLAAVALVLALSLVSVPTVNLLSPLLMGRDVEQVTAPVWLGSALIVSGALLLICLR
jgi:drug/metabolite transporter (DMT)-like permease